MAGKGDKNRSFSKNYRDKFDKIDRSEKPKARNPNIPMKKDINDRSERNEK